MPFARAGVFPSEIFFNVILIFLCLLFYDEIFNLLFDDLSKRPHKSLSDIFVQGIWWCHISKTKNSANYFSINEICYFDNWSHDTFSITRWILKLNFCFWELKWWNEMKCTVLTKKNVKTTSCFMNHAKLNTYSEKRLKAKCSWLFL
jgi:hypothetical protein